VYFTKKQLNILEFIQCWREERGVSPTLEEMASEFGVTKITVYEHLNQLEKKGAIRRTKFRARSIEILTPPPRKHRRDGMPLLGSISAGEPLCAVESEAALRLDTVFPVGESCFALQVEGNSMVGDQICSGDYVIVENKDTANDGDTVVAVLEDGVATLKKYYSEDGRVRLQPSNPGMEPIYADRIEIRGVVIGLLRKYSG